MIIFVLRDPYLAYGMPSSLAGPPAALRDPDPPRDNVYVPRVRLGTQSIVSGLLMSVSQDVSGLAYQVA